jgi:hypothetical protein
MILEWGIEAMRKSHRYTILAGVAAMLAFGFQNCANPKFTETKLDASSSGDPRDGGDDGGASFISKTKSVVVDNVSKIDVLVVIDNSGSMAPEQKNMSDRFGSFIDKIDSLDWRIAVTTTDMQGGKVDLKDKFDGQLLPISGLTGRYFLQSSDGKAAAQTSFGATVQRSEEGSGYEQGVAATYRSVERSMITGDANGGFYRSDAALAIVVVSDADETGLNNNNGNLTSKSVPANLVSLVSNRWPGKPFIFNAIIVQSGDSACKGDKVNNNENYGVNYEKTAALTGGITGTVCATDYSTQLGDIGTGLGKVVRSVSLDCAPVDSDNNGKINLEVTVGGVSTTSFTVSGSLVTFNTAIPKGKIDFSYTCKSK